MKYLIVGLGNIGAEYENTRHNIGFKVLDAFVEASNTCFKPNRFGDVTEVKTKGRVLICLKPNTFMNLSGKAINYWLQKEKIKIENLLVITDDLALPFGKIRLKGKGSDGGHNGLKSIQQILGHPNYARLRFGISSEFNKGQQINYVLGTWSNDENKQLTERIAICTELIPSFCTIGLDRTMSNFNNR
jgi:PTH1 family peptidyl-tRNA hydrolase